MKLSQPLPPMPVILGDSTCAVLPSDITIPLMHHDHLVGNQYFLPFFVFYSESVMLGPRFIPESVFYTQSLMLSPHFIPSPCFIPSP